MACVERVQLMTLDQLCLLRHDVLPVRRGASVRAVSRTSDADASSAAASCSMYSVSSAWSVYSSTSDVSAPPGLGGSTQYLEVSGTDETVVAADSDMEDALPESTSLNPVSVTCRMHALPCRPDQRHRVLYALLCCVVGLKDYATERCKLPTDKITGAQNFNLLPNAPQNGGFLAPDCVLLLEENLPTRIF